MVHQLLGSFGFVALSINLIRYSPFQEFLLELLLAFSFFLELHHKVKRSVDEFEERYKNYQTELINIETQISSKKGLATEVEHKIAEKIADAKQNAADFIAEMAFALPSNASHISDIVVTKRKIQ